MLLVRSTRSSRIAGDLQYGWLVINTPAFEILSWQKFEFNKPFPPYFCWWKYSVSHPYLMDLNHWLSSCHSPSILSNGTSFIVWVPWWVLDAWLKRCRASNDDRCLHHCLTSRDIVRGLSLSMQKYFQSTTIRTCHHQNMGDEAVVLNQYLIVWEEIWSINIQNLNYPFESIKYLLWWHKLQAL